MIEQFRGTSVALITPFDDNGEVDRARLRNLVDWQIERGTDVILTCGTTGESATLSHEEHHDVMNIVIDQVAGRIPVLCGAGSNATHEAISLSQHAEKAGANAILSVAPYYNKPTQEGLFKHFEAIAQAVNIPVILYNVPGRTSCNIAATTVLRLAEIPNIIGVKEASGDLNQIMAILKGRPKNFLVLSGDDALTLPMLSLGADGVISVVANEAPELLHDMVHSVFDGAWDKARAIHYKLLPLMHFNFVETNPIPVKTAAYLMGLVKPNFRLPLVKMSELNTKKMASLLKQLDLI